MNNKRALVGIASLLLLGVGQAWAATQTLTSAGALDGYVTSAGGAVTNNAIVAGDNGADQGLRGFTSFDLTALPAAVTSASVTSATLRVYQTQVDGNPFAGLVGNLGVDHVSYVAPLAAGDYNSVALQAGVGDLSTNNTVEWKTLDVTAQVVDDLTSGRPNSQYRLLFPNESDNDGNFDWINFESGNNVFGTGNLPELVIVFDAGASTTVPALPPIGLVLMGLLIVGVGAVSVASRRNKA